MIDQNNCSPHFRKRPRVCFSPSPCASSSKYFSSSPSSALGSVRSLGNFLSCFAGDGDLPVCHHEGTSLQLDISSYSSNNSQKCILNCCCESCEKFVGLVLDHFRTCPVFCDSWAANGDHADGADKWAKHSQCWKRAERRVQRSVRHLCPFRCYMRAYAPLRNWHSLRLMVIEKLYPISVDQALSGWTCALQSNERDFMCRTYFSPPKRESRFFTPEKVIAHLQASDKNGSCLTPRSPSTPTLASAFGKRLHETSQRPILMPIPTTIESPFGLLEELFADDPWRLLLSAILLNRTCRAQVDTVLHTFLRHWPTYATVACIDEGDESSRHELCKILRPLGICYRRSAGIIRFSKDYANLLQQIGERDTGTAKAAAFHLTKSEITGLYFCGEYAYAAYRLFILQDWNFEPADRMLRSYAEYKRGIESIVDSSIASAF